MFENEAGIRWMENVWGRNTEYLHLFGVNISSLSTYFKLQIRHGISLLAHSIELRQPYHRDLHTLARSRQAYSVTHRRDYKPLQSVGG